MRSLIYGLTLSAALALFVACDNNEKGDDYPDWDISMPDADETTPIKPAVIPAENVNGEQTWPHIVPTGQKKCYDNEKEIPCPLPGFPFYGQDAQYGQYKTRSYVVGAGTVLDDVTNLRWQQDFAENLTWAGAYSYCANLTLDGRKWRLPNTHELKSLIDYSRHRPAIDTAAFPGTPVQWFWGTSRVQDTVNTAWIVYFLDGFVEYTDKDNRYAVRCVENI